MIWIKIITLGILTATLIAVVMIAFEAFINWITKIIKRK